MRARVTEDVSISRHTTFQRAQDTSPRRPESRRAAPRAVLVAASFLAVATPSWSAPFLRGVDLSGLEAVEAQGGRFLEDGAPRDAIELFADAGANFVRLPLVQGPQAGTADVQSVAAIARRARDRGLGLLLAIHYSDRFANAGRQATPEEWTGLPFEDLKVAVFRYTHEVVTELRKENAMPDIVQLGNEVTNGMLWNEGRVGGRRDSDEQWRKFTELLRAAKLGLDAALLEGESVGTMIHIDCGGDTERSVAFFDRVVALDVEFDLIGLSYYPWWHGPLDSLETNLATLAQRFDKDIVVVETTYPWTLRWVDGTKNEVGETSELLRGYEPTPAGQRRFLEDLVRVLAAVPNGHGRGFFWFAPERIAAGGPGSEWENVALFGENGEALPALRVFAPPAPSSAAR